MDIMRREIIQAQKDNLHEILKIVKIIETEVKIMVSRNWQEINGDLLFSEYRIPVLQDEKSYGDGQWWQLQNIMNIYKISLTCTL